MKKKKKYLWIFIAVILILCLTGTTAAFLTRQVATDNILTFGNLQMALRQTTLSSDGNEIPISQKEPFDITSNNIVSRILRVENVGEHSMYVRVALNMNGIAADGTTFDAGDLVTYRLNEADWIYQGDWYYYKQPLAPHEVTNELMTQVIFDNIGVITQNYPGSQFTMHINAQAVQSENNNSDVLSATGWPER